MKKIVGIIVVILMIPVIISVIGDIDRTPIYSTTEFSIIDKPSDKQLLSNDKLLYQLPNTIDITSNLFKNEFLDIENYEYIEPYHYLEINVKPNTYYTIKLKDSFNLTDLELPESGVRSLRVNNVKEPIGSINAIVMILANGQRRRNTITIKSNESGKLYLINDKFLENYPDLFINSFQLIANALPLYVEYYENGILEVDSGILNYTINDNLAYINYIEGEPTQIVDGEFIVSKPTQIISKSNNLFDKSKNVILGDYTLTNTGFIRPENFSSNIVFELPTTASKTYTISFDRTGSGRVMITDKATEIIISNYTTTTELTFVAIGDITRITFGTSTSGINTTTEWSNVRLNEGTEALPYQPYAEHIYNLGDGVELYKLPNDVGDIWLQDGTLERNVGVIDTVNNYAEYGTLTQGTYDNILEFINNNQNKQIKIFFDDIIQENRYKTYLENDTIIINNDTDVIRIYNNDTYTSTRNLDTNITYKLEGYNIIGYIDGEFDNTVLAFFWIIPVLLAGGLIYLLIKRKE